MKSNNIKISILYIQAGPGAQSQSSSVPIQPDMVFGGHTHMVKAVGLAGFTGHMSSPPPAGAAQAAVDIIGAVALHPSCDSHATKS